MGLDMLQSRRLFLECTASTIVRKRMGFGLRSDVAVAAVTMMARVGQDRKSADEVSSTEAPHVNSAAAIGVGAHQYVVVARV